jgi:hypothetical protein
MMKFLLGVSITLLLIISGPTAKAADSWTLYDNFNSEFLDFDNWTPSESTSGGVVIFEVVREIEVRKLSMRTRAYGPTSGEYPQQRGDNNILFPDPDSIHGLKASIRVNEVEATQCPGQDPTRAAARIQGYFFKTGDCSNGACNGSGNSVGAQIFIGRFSNSDDRPNLLSVVGRVIRCYDQACFYHEFQDYPLGTIAIWQWATVSLEYDSVNDQFIFQLDRQQPIVVDNTYDIVSETGTSKVIGTLTRFPYCSEERQIALIGADFDNIYTK